MGTNVREVNERNIGKDERYKYLLRYVQLELNMDVKVLDKWAEQLLDMGKRNNLVNLIIPQFFFLDIIYPQSVISRYKYNIFGGKPSAHLFFYELTLTLLYNFSLVLWKYVYL